MREFFVGHYRPTQEEMERLWSDGLIVLDTNVLLSLYRMPPSTRDEFFSLLEELKERLWIPYHVGLEFQRARLKVIGTGQKDAAKASDAADKAFGAVLSGVKALQIDKRGIQAKEAVLVERLELTRKEVLEAIAEVVKQQSTASHDDAIRDRIDSIIGTRVGEMPIDQGSIAALTEGGDERFVAKIPPGFLDADKEKSQDEAEFTANGLKYQRKFGDLIIWRQLINHVKQYSIKKVLFITSDVKDDWWIRLEGKTIGPLPGLYDELSKHAGVESFWMYTLLQFMEQASTHVKTKISPQALAEVRLSSLARAEEKARQDAEKLVDRVRKLKLNYWRGKFLREPNGSVSTEKLADITGLLACRFHPRVSDFRFRG